HAERGEDRRMHQCREVVIQCAGCRKAEQARARVRVLAPGSRGSQRRPLPEVLHRLVLSRDLVRELQRQTAGGVGSQVEQRRLVDRRATQLRQVLARVVLEGELAGGLRVGGQRGGEYFTDGADFEQGRLRYRYVG